MLTRCSFPRGFADVARGGKGANAGARVCAARAGAGWHIQPGERCLVSRYAGTSKIFLPSLSTLSQKSKEALLTYLFQIGQLAKGQIYYGHFLTGDDHGNETHAERLHFAASLLGPMPAEMSAKLDKLDVLAVPRTHEFESFAEYLRDVDGPRQVMDGDGGGGLSEERYSQLEDLLRRMCAWRVEEWISAAEAVGHGFLRD